MNTQELISVISQHGYELKSAGDKVKYWGKGELPPALLDDMRTHKEELLNWLTAKEKLALFANEFDWDLGDLLDWFKDELDMRDLARWTMPQVRQSVEFYIGHHEYLRKTGRGACGLHGHN